MPKDVDPEKTSRRQQIVATYRMGKQSDPRLGLWLVGAFVVGAAVGFGLFWFLPSTGPLRLVIAIVGSLLLGLLGAALVFGRRVQRSAYRQLEGRPGAAGQALGTLRRGWKTEPMIAFNKQQDVVHRVVGPPGIVLVGEGNPNRLRGLLTNERRKHERVAADIPIHEVMCGNGEGQVPLPRLVKHVTKLGRNVKPAELTDVLNRLKALDASRSNIPMPKGPVPTSMKGLRGQMRGKR
jgi:F0F1-type ATP synthase assembly protein I